MLTSSIGRSAIDAVFRELEVVVFPGSTRPHVRGADYLALVERSTYADDRVRITRPPLLCVGHDTRRWVARRD